MHVEASVVIMGVFQGSHDFLAASVALLQPFHLLSTM